MFVTSNDTFTNAYYHAIPSVIPGCARFPEILTVLKWTHKNLEFRGVLVFLKFWVNSQKLGVLAPQNVEFE